MQVASKVGSHSKGSERVLFQERLSRQKERDRMCFELKPRNGKEVLVCGRQSSCRLPLSLLLVT